jgi:transcriptional regulator with XRE-family HTH domain
MTMSIKPGEGRLQAALGIAVRELRAGAGASQGQLAERAGIHRLYLGGVERGERNPSLETLVRLARALDVSVSELIARAERVERDMR